LVSDAVCFSHTLGDLEYFPCEVSVGWKEDKDDSFP